MHQLTETWYINHRINIYLLDSIDEAALNDQLSSKGRNVGEQFAHMHNVRLMWLKVSAPDKMEGLEKIEKGNIAKPGLMNALEASAKAIGELLEKGGAEGKIKGFKPHPTAFLGYMLAHEAHHRSQIIIALKQSGHRVDQKVAYGIWEWGRFSEQ
jgi:uncharacterized damage-inducible protein DinB